MRNSGAPSAALALPLAVLVTDGSGNPVAGQTVNWQVGAGAGSLSAASSVTGSNGIATITWTLGAGIGQQIVTADVAGLTGTPIVFTALAVLVAVQDILNYYRIQTQAEVTNGLIAEPDRRGAGRDSGEQRQVADGAGGALVR